MWPVITYGILVVLLVVAMVVASYLLGSRHRTSGRDIPYESGMQPTGSARVRYGAKYYLVGLFFILFDVEAAIIFAWAVAFREVGWLGYAEAALFILTLFAGLVYVWKLGGLDWYPGTERQSEDEEQ
jgi:NADH-quinone oxidoreductase subunit A